MVLTESYEPLEPNWRNLPTPTDLRIQDPSQYRFCLDQRTIHANDSYYSTNQALATPVGQRPGNPKIYEKPLIVPPTHAFDYWSEDFVIPSKINDESNTELFQSGYVGTSNCTRNSLCATPLGQQKPVSAYPPENDGKGRCGDLIEPFTFAKPNQFSQSNQFIKSSELQPIGLEKTTQGGRITPGDVYGCNYNPSNLDHNLPVNVSAGRCGEKDCYDDYNKNLYTQILEPGLFVRNQITNNPMSNLGIDWMQQFAPVRCQQEGNNRVFIEENPRTAVIQKPIVRNPVPTPDNVYDPRFTGYGTSYRQYHDDMTGQPRFYYDDVNAIRRPNFIIRSKVDHAPWSESYGPMSNNANASLDYSRALANKQFLEDSLGQRSELEERYMRKYNSEVGWQRRLAPIHTITGGAGGNMRRM